MPRPSPFERARLYIQRSAPRAIQGSSGDNTTYAVACALVIEFALSDDEAWTLLMEYNKAKCLPEWSERDLAAKLRSARNMAKSKPNEVGRLLDQDRSDYTGPVGSATNGPRPSQVQAAKTARAPTGPPKVSVPSGKSGARTLRTPLFNIRKAGEGAEPRTTRTLRTLFFDSLIQAPKSIDTSLVEKKLSEPSVKKSEPEPAKPVPEQPKPEPKAEGVPLGEALPGCVLSAETRAELSGLLGGVDPDALRYHGFESVEALANERAKETGTPLTILLSKSARIVRVKPDGKRLLMGRAETNQ